jgi:hypothetical protein
MRCSRRLEAGFLFLPRSRKSGTRERRVTCSQSRKIRTARLGENRGECPQRSSVSPMVVVRRAGFAWGREAIRRSKRVAPQ